MEGNHPLHQVKPISLQKRLELIDMANIWIYLNYPKLVSLLCRHFRRNRYIGEERCPTFINPMPQNKVNYAGIDSEVKKHVG